MIRSLKISGFRSLRDATLELRPLNVLIGPNQSGKTNLLDALDLLKQAGEGRLKSAIDHSRGGFENIIWAGPNVEEIRFDVEVSFLFKFDEPEHIINASFSLIKSKFGYRIGRYLFSEADQVIFGAEEGFGDVLIPPPFDQREIPFLGFMQIASMLPELESKPAHNNLIMYVRSILSSTAIYPGFVTQPRWASVHPGSMPQIRLPQPVTHATEWDPSGDNLVNVLYTLSQDEDRWDDFKASIQTGFPDFDNIAFPADAGQGRIALAWVDRRFPRSCGH